jgi:vitamin B12 transporter
MRKKIFVVAAVFFSSQVHAQDSVKVLDQVEVTSNKYPVKQSQSGKVIIVIDRATIDKSAGKTLSELLNEQAGVIVSGSLNNLGTNQSIYMQGAGDGRTLITIDGVPVMDPTAINNFFDINLISLDNVERIEICKGSQSTLYGSDAIAGVINIITVKPGITTPLNVKATVARGNYGTDKADLQVYGKIARQLVYNVRYAELNSTGFSAAYDSSGHGNFDNDGDHQSSITSNLAWEASKTLTIKGFAQYNYYNTDVDAGAFKDAKDETNANNNFLGGFGFTYKKGATTLNGNYRYNTTSRLNIEDSVLGQNYHNYFYKGRTQYAELFGNTNLGRGFTWLYGGDYSFDLMGSNNFDQGYAPTIIDDTSYSQVSLYTSMFYTKDNFNVELGGRFNDHSKYGNHETYTFNPSYNLCNNWKVYASVSSGYKAPSLYQLYAPYGSGNPKLQPETSVNYEAGVQYTNKIFTSRVNYFNRQIQNGLDFDYVNFVYYNFTRENAQGIEWENTLKISKVFSVTANYTWTKEKVTMQSRVTTNDTTYDYALRQPEHTVNASLNIQPVQKLLISVSAHYESKRYDVGGYQVPDVVLNDFCILNAYAQYEYSKSVKFFVDTKNITNEKFFTLYGYNSIPFMFSGGVTVNL